MNNELMVFEQREVLGNDFKIYGDKESPLFLAKDVATWIENTNTSQMVKNIDEDEKVKKITPIYNAYNGKYENQECLFLTEDGLYEVLMQSRKPIAKSFKKEVKAILKQIRLTGGTVQVGREEEFINTYFTSFSDEVKKAMVMDLHKTNTEQKERIAELTPKAQYHDKVLKPNGLKTITDIAKDLGVSGRALNKTLQEEGIIYKGKNGKCWKPYAKYQYLIPEYCDYEVSGDEKYSAQHLKWTELGRKFIIEEVLKLDMSIEEVA